MKLLITPSLLDKSWAIVHSYITGSYEGCIGTEKGFGRGEVLMMEVMTISHDRTCNVGP